MWCISRPVRNTGTAPSRIRRCPTSRSRRLAVKAAGNRERGGDGVSPFPTTASAEGRQFNGAPSLSPSSSAAVPAHTLKQAAQVRDLTTVRHVIPGHLPQGGSHRARLGYRRDDAPYFQVRIAQGSQVGAASLFDCLVIAYP